MVLAPMPVGVQEVDRSTPGGDTTIRGTGSSVARLDIPRGAVIAAADLEWTGSHCDGPPALLFGATRLIPDRITGDRADLAAQLGALVGRHGIAVSVGGPPCADSWSLHVVWWVEEPAPAPPAVELSAAENRALVLEGTDAVHELRIRNIGDVDLSGLSLAGEGVRCDPIPGMLLPSAEKTAICRTSAKSAPTTTSVAVTGRDTTGRIATASAELRTNGFRPSIALELEEVPAERGDTGPATVRVRVRNTSPVPLEQVAVGGSPAACVRPVGRLEPDQSTVYTCRVGRGAVVTLSATGLPVVDGVVAAFTSSARNSAVLTLAQPVAPAQADRVPPAPPPERLDSGGPLENPERTAGFIGILGALVMMVSVGALSSASRASK
ncbi:hypothetical protein [Saccharopolyspora taberi]|uniref:hypothetical protein n=1 Tax=Saccharopolyspora taberi TaxID=60895 RepID=UPI0031DA8A52